MQVAVVAFLLCVCSVLSQPPYNPATLYPVTADGFDIVLLDDMSFVTEIHFQSFQPGNYSFFIFGGASVRSVIINFRDQSFLVASTPNERWHLPFVDVHSFQYLNESWFIGPVEGLGIFSRGTQGYELDIAVLTTMRGNTSHIRFLAQPLGFDGTFYSAWARAFNPNFVVAYFAGYFLDPVIPNLLHFGVFRAHYNTSILNPNNPEPPPGTDGFAFNYSTDAAVLVNQSAFITYNPYFKPFIFHLWNVSWDSNPNNTYTYVLDPATNTLFTAKGNFDPTIPLMPAPFSNLRFRGEIVSAQIYYPMGILVVGVAVSGTSNGEIAFVHLANASIHTSLQLPANYSDPRALAIDEFAGIAYVGMNGGPSVLRIDINKMAITGYQALPFFLHRVWSALVDPFHVYFVSNEQHAKVFRVAKTDFCPTECMRFGYCSKGSCECSYPFTKSGNECTWPDAIVAERNKQGEVALGILFMFSTIAAGAGWYLWWKGKRNTYQSV